MSYFDLPSDSDLIATDLQGHPRLQTVASGVEADILLRYRSDEGAIQLEGYDSDPAAADEMLRDALKRTIADVANHRIRHERDTSDMSTSDGRRSRSPDARFDPDWPKRWDSRLASFDQRPAPWRP